MSLTPLMVALIGCGPAEKQDTGEPQASLDYYRDVQPIIATHCGGCHVDGGVGPFRLTTYDELVAFELLVRNSIVSGSMPPWPADPECRSFQHERLMSAADVATVLAWMDEGMAEGDPADAQPVEPPELDLAEVSVITRSADLYTPNADIPDDYHCLVMDVGFTEQTYLSAYQVVPDVSGSVHHIIFYLVPPSGAAAMLEADAATPEPGYACFGSSGHGGVPMGVWAPGGLPMRFPESSAFVLEPGSKIVAQMHYNTAGGSLGPDQTELHLAYLPAAPKLRVTMPILNGFFTIPAGDPAYAVELAYEVTGDQPKQIFSVMPHMHLLGRTIDLRLDRAGEQTCVARIDDWDFRWQQFYDLKPSEFIEVRDGDTLRYTCVYDNSPANQPIVDGEQQQPPVPVAFGEGTHDEMCLIVAAMVEPFVADTPATTCEGVNECFEESCAPEDGACFVGCGTQESDACGGCLLPGLGACGQSLCPSEFAALVGCLGANCDADLSDAVAIQSCLANECKAEFDVEWSCLGPQLLTGACNGDLGPCGIEY